MKDDYHHQRLSGSEDAYKNNKKDAIGIAVATFVWMLVMMVFSVYYFFNGAPDDVAGQNKI